jgi:hypothetical protein
MSYDITPRTRGWKALLVPLNTVEILHVVGEVELASANKVPHLSLSDPPGDNSEVLNLDLAIETRGPGEPRRFWCVVGFSHPMLNWLPTIVRVTWMGREIGRAEVAEE